MAIAWGKCKIELGLLGAGDSLPSELNDVGKILNKSAGINFDDGEERELISEGGEVEEVDVDESKGTVIYSVICKDVDAYATAHGMTTSTDEFGRKSFVQKTTRIEGAYFIRVTPKKAGAMGYEVYKAVGRVKPRWDTSEGWILEYTWKMLFNADGNLARPFEYSGTDISLDSYEFITGAAQDTVAVTPTSAGEWKASTSDTWITLSVSSGDSGDPCTLTIAANTGVQRTGTVKFTDGLCFKYFSVKQAAGE
jgi:hypothetical protein